MMRHYRRGFTLIELIVVIAILVIIVAAVFVAIDPARRINTANNARRWTDVRAILESVKKYQVDNNGNLPDTPVTIDDTPNSVQLIGNGSGVSCASTSCDGVVLPDPGCYATGLTSDLDIYLKDIPQDPKFGDVGDTRYYINEDEHGFITVGACDEEGEGFAGGGIPPVIAVSR